MDGQARFARLCSVHAASAPGERLVRPPLPDAGTANCTLTYSVRSTLYSTLPTLAAWLVAVPLVINLALPCVNVLPFRPPQDRRVGI